MLCNIYEFCLAVCVCGFAFIFVSMVFIFVSMVAVIGIKIVQYFMWKRKEKLNEKDSNII